MERTVCYKAEVLTVSGRDKAPSPHFGVPRQRRAQVAIGKTCPLDYNSSTRASRIMNSRVFVCTREWTHEALKGAWKNEEAARVDVCPGPLGLDVVLRLRPSCRWRQAS